MELIDQDRRYGLAVLALCLTGTAIATAADQDEGSWLLAVTFTAAVATVLVPGGLPTVRCLRSSPHVLGFWGVLVGVAALAGATDLTPEMMVGVAGCAAAGYAAALAVIRYLQRRD